MSLYTVYENPNPLSKNELIFVSDKFSWSALLFPIIWPLIKGSWIISILMLLIFGIVFFTTKIFLLDNIIIILSLVGFQIVYYAYIYIFILNLNSE